MAGMTNAQLAQVMNDGFDKVNTRIDRVHQRIDSVVGQQAQNSSSKGVSLSDEQWNVMKWLILIIGALVGVKLV